MKTRILAVVLMAAMLLSLWAVLEYRPFDEPRRGPTQGQALDPRSPQAPNPLLTPGDVLTTDLALICKVGYSATVRDVSAADHKGVFKDYGITDPKRGEYEVDHLISLQLGGSNSRKNLWPQSYLSQPYNAHLKDKLENRLRKMVCKGEMPIEEAQRRIATDWIGSYNEFYGVPGVRTN